MIHSQWQRIAHRGFNAGRAIFFRAALLDWLPRALSNLQSQVEETATACWVEADVDSESPLQAAHTSTVPQAAPPKA